MGLLGTLFFCFKKKKKQNRRKVPNKKGWCNCITREDLRRLNPSYRRADEVRLDKEPTSGGRRRY
jgi:hypothetical protein